MPTCASLVAVAVFLQRVGFAPWDVRVPRELQAAAAERAGENNRDKIAASELWLVTEGSAPHQKMSLKLKNTHNHDAVLLLESTFLLFVLFFCSPSVFF